MKAKSSVRLRLECLETRRLLSAIGLPLVPLVAPPSAGTMSGTMYPWSGSATAGEFSRIGGQHVVQAAMQDVVWNLPDSSPVVNLDPTKWQGDEITSIASIDAGSVSPRPEIPTSNLQLLSYGMADEPSASVTLTMHDPPPLRFAGEVAADAPPDVDPVMLSSGMSDFQPDIDTLLPGRDPADFRGYLGRGAVPAVPSFVIVVENDISAGMESSAAPATFAPQGSYMPPAFIPAVSFTTPATFSTPAKSHVPDMLSGSDASAVGVQGMASAETMLPASSDVAHSPATNLAFSDAASSNSMEDGFITLAAATTPGPGNSPSYNTGFQGVGGAELDQGNWLTDLLPNVRRPANAASGNSKAAPSDENFAAAVSLRPAAVILQPATEAEEGGGIELAICAPSTAAAGDNPLPSEESTVGAAQQLAEIRPESGVGLFCDIEVAIAPTLPMGDSASTATTYQDAGSFVIDVGSHRWKANAATEFVPPRTESSQRALAGLADTLPVLLGVTVLASRGGLRLEEEVSERERRLFSITRRNLK